MEYLFAVGGSSSTISLHKIARFFRASVRIFVADLLCFICAACSLESGVDAFFQFLVTLFAVFLGDFFGWDPSFAI